MELVDTTAAVATPERVAFRYRLAGPGRRTVAWLIDFGIRAVFFAGFLVVVSVASLLPGGQGIGMGMALVVLFLLEWAYGAVFETLLSGRTPGKLVLSLRVVRDDGSPGRFVDFVLRNLLRAVDFLPAAFGLAVLTMSLDRKFRRLGDLLAGTVVVVEERSRMHGEVRIDPPVSEAERQELPPSVALDRDEVTAIEAFLRRRRTFSDERAEELAWLLGPALAERTGVQADRWERVLALAYARAVGKDR